MSGVSAVVVRVCWSSILSPASAHVANLFFPKDESGDEESVSQTDKTELQNTLRTLSSKVEDLSTCNDLIAKHGTALQRSLSELESLRLPAESNEKIKQVNERATLFRITSNAMINVSAAVPVSLLGSSQCWETVMEKAEPVKYCFPIPGLSVTLFIA